MSRDNFNPEWSEQFYSSPTMPFKHPDFREPFLITLENTQDLDFPSLPDLNHFFHLRPDKTFVRIRHTDLDQENLKRLQSLGLPRERIARPSKEVVAWGATILVDKMEKEYEEYEGVALHPYDGWVRNPPRPELLSSSV